ncbi:type I restriction endonuclease subunit S [Bacteroides finegoldii]|uniref:restriction endonuclease subunit S n=1 Tax=Bacteroides finegoldii TaxID=338188 RepID=UPI0012311250|nr:restriction endonuclease subunit S [Bacteroides finegoldii]KAA5244582.1 type I restriction endonuclease subunit S [Bacteroides finegoldii]
MKCIDEEIPFEIPQGWEWCRLSLLIYPPKYGTSKKSVPSGLLPVLRMGNIQDGEIVFDKLVYSNDLDDNKKLLLQYGDLLFNRTNSAELVGKTAIFRGQRNAIFAGYLILLRPIFINSEYLNLLLNTPYARDYCNEVKTIGVQQCNINAEKISNLLIPVPNLHETVAIVEKVKNIALPIIKYGEFYQKLKHLNRELPIIIRKSILQEAIQGKLVPQIAEEGTARELLEQIKTEKEKLVREGKLKKSALTDSVIFRGDDNKYYERINAQTVEIELPFEYPNNWSVLRLKDICQLIDGEKRNGKGICLDAKYLRGKSSATIVEKGKFVYAGDNIILVDGENSGEVFTVPQDGYMGSTFKQLWLSSAMWKPYILAFILFYKEDLRNSKRGAAIPHLNKELFYNLPIGIPPYQEQQRIAKRINELSQLLK